MVRNPGNSNIRAGNPPEHLPNNNQFEPRRDALETTGSPGARV